MIQDKIKNNVFVFTKGFFLQSSTGAGIVIKHHHGKDNSSLILTAAHVVTGINYKKIHLNSKNELDIKNYKILADFRYTSINLDLCIIETKDLSSYLDPVILSSEKPQTNNNIIAIGYPQSMGMYTQTTIEGSIVELDHGYIYSTLHSEYGFSGAPYINKNSEIIGIHHGKSRKKNLRKGASIYAIMDYLQENKFYEFNKR